MTHTRRSSTRSLVLALCALLVAALALSACGDENDSNSSGDGDATTTSAASATTGGPTAGGAETDLSSKPTVTVPDQPATELGIRDIVVGTGPEVAAGDTVTVHYVGVGQQSGQEFDTSWGGEPVTFPLDGVIQGWSEGLVGMKVGGRRELVIPGDMAYGANSPTPAIQPNETLVFVVDLLDVQKA